MNYEELAAELNARNIQYGNEPDDLFAVAKDHGLVVVFGASDDLMEFRGAIYDELDAYEGTTAYLTSDGLVQSECPEGEDCPYFKRARANARTIEAEWCKRDDCSWTFSTEIPHASFNIHEGDDLYSVGIVFALKDLSA